MRSRTSCIGASLVFVALAGCGDSAKPDGNASSAATGMHSGTGSTGSLHGSASTTSSTASGGTTMTSASAMASASAAVPVAPLTDDQIAQVLIDINQGEIDQGNVAMKQATDADTKKLANTMVTEHTAWLKDANDLFKKDKLSPAKSDVSTDLERDSKGLVSRISNLKGGEFDQAYVEAQVKNHQDGLDLIDKNLMVNVKNADLKDFLKTVRGKVQGHLEHCKKVLSALGGVPGTAKGAASASPAAGAPKK
jgi:putative membrane protein